MSKGEKASFGGKPSKTGHLSTKAHEGGKVACPCIYMANKPTITNSWSSVQGLDIANAKVSLNLIRVTLGLNVFIAKIIVISIDPQFVDRHSTQTG